MDHHNLFVNDFTHDNVNDPNIFINDFTHDNLGDPRHCPNHPPQKDSIKSLAMDVSSKIPLIYHCVL